MRRNVVAIDGYSGVGSGTIAKAFKSEWLELGEDIGSIDTGSLYRCIGIEAYQIGHDPDSITARQVADIVSGVHFDAELGVFMPHCADEDFEKSEHLIRSPHADDQSSAFGDSVVTRAAVNTLCNQTVLDNNDKLYVIDGRQEFSRFVGIGHYPVVGLFVVCDPLARAERRLAQGHNDNTIEEMAEAIESRDEADKSREHEPIKVYDGSDAYYSTISHSTRGEREILAPEAREQNINNPEGKSVQFIYDTSFIGPSQYRTLARFMFDATKNIRSNS